MLLFLIYGSLVKRLRVFYRAVMINHILIAKLSGAKKANSNH